MARLLCRRVSLDTYGWGNDRYGGPDGTRVVTGVPHQTDHRTYTVDDLLDRLARTGELGKPRTHLARGYAHMLGLLTRTPESLRRAPLDGITA